MRLDLDRMMGLSKISGQNRPQGSPRHTTPFKSRGLALLNFSLCARASPLEPLTNGHGRLPTREGMRVVLGFDCQRTGRLRVASIKSQATMQRLPHECSNVTDSLLPSISGMPLFCSMWHDGAIDQPPG